MRAAAEAVIKLLGLRDGEAGAALVVEGATRRVFLALPLQRDARTDDLDDIRARQKFIDESVWNAGHALGVCGLQPVSYTHLDVYKRQGQYRDHHRQRAISASGDTRRVCDCLLYTSRCV